MKKININGHVFVVKNSNEENAVNFLRYLMKKYISEFQFFVCGVEEFLKMVQSRTILSSSINSLLEVFYLLSVTSELLECDDLFGFTVYDD